MRMTGGQALAGQLAAEGIDTVFGVPGVQLDPAMDALYGVADRIRFVQTRHEQGAAYMADGYARSSGRVGAFMVVPGPGMLNAAAALSTAYACSSPVLAIVAQIPSSRIGAGLGLLHEIPGQSQTLAGLTKFSALATAPGQIPGLVREAVRQLRTGRPRPVAIEVPPDVLAADADIELVTPPPDPAPAAADTALLARAAGLLAAARRPVINAGWGVTAAQAGDELRALAETLGAPVVASLTGQGALPAHHPLSFGYVAGHELLADADVVLGVGTRFVDGRGSPRETGAETQLVLLNAESADLGDPRRPAVALHADARAGLAAMRAALGDHETRGWPDRELTAAREREHEALAYLQPQLSWIDALRDAIPDDGVLVNELTQVGYVAQLAYPVRVPRTFLTPGYQGTLGYGFAAALGAKIALPDRAVVSISGDGGFGWNLVELATARKYGIALVTVVFRDDKFGNVAKFQLEQYGGRMIGVDLCNPDLPALAAAFGVRGATAGSPTALRAALAEALAANEPTLIDVPVGEMPSPWPLIHRSWPMQAS